MKHRPILENKLKKMPKNPKKVCIGLIGIHHGAGTTYTGILLANYMAMEREMKTAFVSYANPKDLELLQEFYEFQVEDMGSFAYDLITFYKSIHQREELIKLCREYDVVIVDYGTDILEYWEEFQRCDRKFVVGGMAEWNQRRLDEFLKQWDAILPMKDWSFIIPLGDESTLRHIKKKWKHSFYAIPYERCSMSLTKDTIQLFSKLL